MKPKSIIYLGNIQKKANSITYHLQFKDKLHCSFTLCKWGQPIAATLIPWCVNILMLILLESTISYYLFTCNVKSAICRSFVKMVITLVFLVFLVFLIYILIEIHQIHKLYEVVSQLIVTEMRMNKKPSGKNSHNGRSTTLLIRLEGSISLAWKFLLLRNSHRCSYIQLTYILLLYG